MEVPMPISCSEDPSLPIKKRQVFTGLSDLVQKFGFWIKNNILLTMTILSVGIGLVLGIILRQFHLSSTLETVIAFPGQIFMQMLKLLILPLIIFSLISSLAQMDAKKSGRMGIIAVSYYFTTATLATIVSITLVLLIHPGNPKMKENHIANTTTHANVSPLNSIFDLIRNMFPDNIVRATFQKIQSSSNSSSSGGDDDGSTEYIWGMNVLGIIVFCSALGISLSQLGEQAKHVVNIFVILERAVMNLIKAVMWFAPVGIISLIAGNLIELDDLSRTAEGLMLYLLTILAGLMIHWLITTPILYIILTRKNPLIVARTMLQAFFTALGTSSSGAALPISINSMETKMKIDKRIARFILPLGNTVNVDGNALYEAVAVIFIAQMNNMHLSLPQVITISITTTLASMGTGSVPIGLLPVLLVLNSIGLPVSDVTLLFTVDWLIDRIRTAINVMGDGFTTAIVSHHLGDQLVCIEEETEMSEECSVNKNDANDMKGLLTPDLNGLEIGCHDKKLKSKNVV